MADEAYTKPTPGPWEFLELGRTEEEYNRGRALTISGGPNHDDIANVFSCDDASVSISRAEAVANARLIAAAPKLLDALKGLTNGMPELLKSIGYADEEQLIENALAVIAEAEPSTSVKESA